jgi:hypothetical protein
MNTDVLQIIFDFTGFDERIGMRFAFGEIFRYPRLNPNHQMLNICLKHNHRTEKRMCYFGGHERIETFINKHGMRTNISLGALCILPWRIGAACTKPLLLMPRPPSSDHIVVS